MLSELCGLQSNTSILSLDLSDNWLGYHGGLAVCDMLKENCFISELVSAHERDRERDRELLGDVFLPVVSRTCVCVLLGDVCLSVVSRTCRTITSTGVPVSCAGSSASTTICDV